VRDEVPEPDGDDDGDPAHGRGPALGLVGGRSVLPDLLAEALPGEETDQVRGEQDRHRQGHTRRDQDAPHRAPPPGAAIGVAAEVALCSSSPVATRSRPADRDALTSTTSSGRSWSLSSSRAAATSGTSIESFPESG